MNDSINKSLLKNRPTYMKTNVCIQSLCVKCMKKSMHEKVQTINIQLKYNMKMKILQEKSLDPTDFIKHV